VLREIARCREMVLLIPAPTPEVHFAANIAIDAIWNLEEHIRHLVRLRHEGQSSWAKIHHDLSYKNVRRFFSASLHKLFDADDSSSCILQLCLSATLTKKPRGWKKRPKPSRPKARIFWNLKIENAKSATRKNESRMRIRRDRLHSPTPIKRH
jgi:hypothetical protein